MADTLITNQPAYLEDVAALLRYILEIGVRLTEVMDRL